MSKTAPGKIECSDGKSISATFIIDKFDYQFSATIVSSQSSTVSIQPFASNNAILTYNAVSDLTSASSYRGKVGTDDFSLTLDTSAVIAGRLNAPGVNPAHLVSGTRTPGK